MPPASGPRSPQEKPVPHYFFDLVDDVTVHDHKGITLPDANAACEYAKTFARELIEAKATLFGEPQRVWSVRVHNSRFEPIMTLPFATLIGSEERKG
jgi:hypothetical protein